MTTTTTATTTTTTTTTTTRTIVNTNRITHVDGGDVDAAREEV